MPSFETFRTMLAQGARNLLDGALKRGFTITLIRLKFGGFKWGREDGSVHRDSRK